MRLMAMYLSNVYSSVCQAVSGLLGPKGSLSEVVRPREIVEVKR